MKKFRPKCCIVVLNYNGWPDTIELLESLFRLNYPDYQVIVVDNCSTDDSVNLIRRWADGAMDYRNGGDGTLNRLTRPPVRKPVPYTLREICTGQDYHALMSTDQCALVLLRNYKNALYAGGNNVGLKYALATDRYQYYWLLNNDTSVEPDALDHLVDKMEADEKIGLCGSVLLYYFRPEIIQAVGGRYNKWLGTSGHNGEFHQWPQAVDSTRSLPLHYLPGASVLTSGSFLKSVGLLSEEFGMYCEDLDWGIRARGRFTLALAEKSIVYHKEGASTGGSNLKGEKSRLADFYGIRSRIRITKKHFPFALPLVLAGLTVTILNRIKRRQWSRVGMVVRIVLHELFRGKTGGARWDKHGQRPPGRSSTY